MITSSAIFAVQDAISRHLGEAVNIYMVLTIRFWFFALFVMILAARSSGGFMSVARTQHPWAQLLRGLLLITEIGLMIFAFVKLGLIETHAIFVCYPLLITVLSGPILGEKVGWRRWLAVLVGFIGVLIILNPTAGVFSAWALVPFGGALTFALYSLATRYVSAKDSATTSFFWTGIIGAIVITPFAFSHWQNMAWGDWGLLGLLCITSVVSHGLLIRAYEVAEASAIQPFAYFQLPFVSIIGMLLFAEVLRINVVIGGALVVAAGIFTLWRQRLRERQALLAAAIQANQSRD